MLTNTFPLFLFRKFWQNDTKSHLSHFSFCCLTGNGAVYLPLRFAEHVLHRSRLLGSLPRVCFPPRTVVGLERKFELHDVNFGPIAQLPVTQFKFRFCSMMEKSHILKSPFIHLYVSPTNFDTETCFCQNNQFLTVSAGIFDSICLMSSHACRMPCRAGAETKQSQRVWEMLSVTTTTVSALC